MNRNLTETAESGCHEDMSLIQAFTPYIALTVITLSVLLISPVKRFLSQWSLGFAFPETVTGLGFVNPATAQYAPFSPLTHASVFLLLSALLGLLYFRKKGWIQREETGAVFRRSIIKTVPSGFAVVGFIIMSRIMGGSGQTAVLASGIANVMGKAYVILSPVVGLLGAFMTSSNMASNILFGEFQLMTAAFLGLDTAAILGAQTAGGSIGGAICPGNIVLGTTTAGILGEEGSVLKKILPITITTAVLVGVVLFIALVLI